MNPFVHYGRGFLRIEALSNIYALTAVNGSVLFPLIRRFFRRDVVTWNPNLCTLCRVLHRIHCAGYWIVCRVVNLYHPQHSCGKVLFLHVSVILFTGGGVWQADIPRGRQTPPPGQVTAIATDGTHPTGMHFCLYCARYKTITGYLIVYIMQCV